MASLSVNCNEVPEEGLRLTLHLIQEDLGFSEDDPQFKGTLALESDVLPTVQGAHVSGFLKGTILQQCVRCLEKYEEEVNVPFSGQYQRPVEELRKHLREADRQDFEQDGEEFEAYPLVANQLDLSDMVREHLILSLPIQPLCRSGCLGLCQVCGRNLNGGLCECKGEEHFSPFSVLRTVRDKSGKTRSLS